MMKISCQILTVLILSLLCPRYVYAGESAKTKSNSNNAEIIYECWSNPTLKRSLPIKIYLPQNKAGLHPIFIFSHGLGGSREAAQYLGEYLARHNYICFFVQHPGSDEEVWKSAQSGGIAEKFALLKKAANFQNLSARAFDIHFVIDELERRNQIDPNIKNLLDLNKIALGGHSFGAGTTLAIAGQSYPLNFGRNFKDNRVKAAIYYSPPVNLKGRSPQAVFGNIKIPGMVMTGTDDNSPIGDTSAEDRPLAYEGIQASDQYLLNFYGGNHMLFGGRQGKIKSQNEDKNHQIIQVVSLAFLNAYLLNNQNDETWLKTTAKDYLKNACQYKFK
jgi:predicted dienelactone hydrolase